MCHPHTKTKQAANQYSVAACCLCWVASASSTQSWSSHLLMRKNFHEDTSSKRILKSGEAWKSIFFYFHYLQDHIEGFSLGYMVTSPENSTGCMRGEDHCHPHSQQLSLKLIVTVVTEVNYLWGIGLLCGDYKNIYKYSFLHICFEGEDGPFFASKTKSL